MKRRVASARDVLSERIGQQIALVTLGGQDVFERKLERADLRPRVCYLPRVMLLIEALQLFLSE